MASVWPPEISIVYHRRNQGGGKGAMPPLISSLYCSFVRSPTPNTIARLKSKYLAPPNILGWFCLCCVWFVDPTSPESKSKSTSETVYEAFNFSLKLLSVLSKQLDP